MVQKKETANIWKYKVSNIANIVRLWKLRLRSVDVAVIKSQKYLHV